MHLWIPVLPSVPRWRFDIARFWFNEFVTGLSVLLAILLFRARGVKFDIVHFHGDKGFYFSAPILKRVLGKRVILTTHGLGESAKLFPGRLGSRFVSSSLNSVDHVILVGRFLKSWFGELGLNENDLKVIKNGHDSSSGSSEKARSIREEYHGKNIVVGVARLLDWKGVETTLKALAKLKQKNTKNWVYLHVGDGPERGHLESITKNMKLERSVVFLGHLAYEETMTYIMAGDFFVLPSWGEAFGIVYLEAMARGLPAIGCYGAGGEETIIDGKTGYLVQPHDAVGLAQKIEKLFNEEDSLKYLSAGGKKHAEKFSWTRNSIEYLNLYKKSLVS